MVLSGDAYNPIPSWRKYQTQAKVGPEKVKILMWQFTMAVRDVEEERIEFKGEQLLWEMATKMAAKMLLNETTRLDERWTKGYFEESEQDSMMRWTELGLRTED